MLLWPGVTPTRGAVLKGAALGRLRTAALEHAPLFVPTFFPAVLGFPRLRELSAEGRLQGTSTLTLITVRSSFASWALGHHVPQALFSLTLLGLSTGGSLASSKCFYRLHRVAQVLTSFPSILLI